MCILVVVVQQCDSSIASLYGDVILVRFCCDVGELLYGGVTLVSFMVV